MRNPFIMLREEWERTFDAIPDLIAILDDKHEVVRVNKAMAERLDVSPEECIGVKCFAAVHGSSCPPDFCPHSKLLKDDNEHTEEVHEDNLGGHFLVTASPVYNENGSVVGSVHVARDITQRRQMENELKEALDTKENLLQELKRSNKELERFAYVASHDLQEPLRMVSNFLTLLERRYKGKIDPDADEFIYYAVDGAQRMQQLINDLLIYSRVTSSGDELEKFNLKTALDESILNLQVPIQENKVKITHNPLPTIRGDSIQFAQLFQNLIGNAIKFRGEEMPEIHVRAEADGDNWLIQVKDNGIGIDPQHQDQIFKVFQRLHERNKYPGTGIGLSICQKIVERHGGTIWVDSKPGEGSNFCFIVPK